MQNKFAHKLTQMNQSTLIFTRYLYIKDEVRIALLVSILNKSEDAIFWAYELYYSGFKEELLNLLWKIYYDFFATLNPAYESYLLKNHKELMDDINDTKDMLVSSLIQDLLFRPFNSDIFMIRNVCENFVIDIEYQEGTTSITSKNELVTNLTNWIATNDLRSIAQYLSMTSFTSMSVFSPLEIYDVCLDIFETELTLDKPKLRKIFNSLIKQINTSSYFTVLLTWIVRLFSKRANCLKRKGKSIYIMVEKEDIIPYKTIMGTHNTILKRACVCNIDNWKHLSLFKLTRHKYDIHKEYRYNWEYFASYSPLWSQRITDHGGRIDHNAKKVIFDEDPDDELMQEFYGLYGLEPDEQPLEIQQKSICPIEKSHNWKWFYDQYKQNGIFEVYEEELVEFDNDGVTY